MELKTIQITEGLYVLIGGNGGNIGVSIGEDGVFVIDDEYADLSEKIIKAIRELTVEPVKFVINTHWHPDHVGGNTGLSEIGALIVAHENTRKRVITEQHIGGYLPVAPLPASAWPVLTFTEDITFHFNNDEIHSFHLQHAHTDGDVAIYFRKANVLYTGDIYTADQYPYIDIDTGGSVKGSIAAIERLLAIVNAETIIVGGHGPARTTKGELLLFRDMLVDISTRVVKLTKQGRALAQIQTDETIRQYDKIWGGGFIDRKVFVQILHRGLMKE